jgi:ABC-type Fe3+-hydroxamate transport system substrate-binding protein
MRIVSLVPSLTHTVAQCPDLLPNIVGCTQFCVEPKGLHRQAQLVGGTKDPRLDDIAALKPTHILTNDEENTPDAVAKLARIAPVLRTLPKHPSDIGPLFRAIGQFCGQDNFFGERAERFEELLRQIESTRQWQWHQIKPGLRFLYLIWREPYMVAGPDSYISRLLALLGLKNAYEGDERYPALNVEAMHECQPDILFLSSEPYPFRKRDWARLGQEWPENTPAGYSIDGRTMSWHGEKSFEALQAFARLTSGKNEISLLKPLASKPV